jgi:hypothetical protein
VHHSNVGLKGLLVSVLNATVRLFSWTRVDVFRRVIDLLTSAIDRKASLPFHTLSACWSVLECFFRVPAKDWRNIGAAMVVLARSPALLADLSTHEYVVLRLFRGFSLSVTGMFPRQDKTESNVVAVMKTLITRWSTLLLEDVPSADARRCVVVSALACDGVTDQRLLMACMGRETLSSTMAELLSVLQRDSTLGWKYQLFITSCFTRLTPVGCVHIVPVGVWEWIVAGVASSVVPIRNLCCDVLAVWLSDCQRTGTRPPDVVQAHLRSPLFTTSLLQAFYNWQSEQDAGRVAQWSEGISDLSNCVRLPSVRPETGRIPTQSPSSKFRDGFGTFIADFINVLGVSVIPVLDTSARLLLTEDDNIVVRQATVAAVIAGMLSVLHASHPGIPVDVSLVSPAFTLAESVASVISDPVIAGHFVVALRLITDVYPGSSLDNCGSFADALSYSCYRTPLSQCWPTVLLVLSTTTSLLCDGTDPVEAVVSPPPTAAGEAGFGIVARWLALVTALLTRCGLQEIGGSVVRGPVSAVQVFTDSVGPVALANMGHAYKAVRTGISRLLGQLFLLTAAR